MSQIVYLMGPSAAGKDSILTGLRTIGSKNNFVIAHRYITRSANAGGENHIELSPAEYVQRKQAGFFLFSWEANGMQYGIGQEVLFWVDLQVNVVVNGSRAHYLKLSDDVKSRLLPIYIDADKSVRISRMLQRGRENKEEIEARLKREPAIDFQKNGIRVVSNNSNVQVAVMETARIIKGC